MPTHYIDVLIQYVSLAIRVVPDLQPLGDQTLTSLQSLKEQGTSDQWRKFLSDMAAFIEAMRLVNPSQAQALSRLLGNESPAINEELLP